MTRMIRELHFKVKRSKVKVTRPLWAAVQVTTCRELGHAVAAALRAAQLIIIIIIIIILYTSVVKIPRVQFF